MTLLVWSNVRDGRDHHPESASGLLMGLLYGLIAVGLALIFGLMDVVNFAHGEFLMIAMYATFFLFAFFAVDPLLAAPLVGRRCSCSGRRSIC